MAKNLVLRDEFKERGIAVCNPRKMYKWEKHVDEVFARDNSRYSIMMIEDALAVLEAYEAGKPISEVRDIVLGQGHCEGSLASLAKELEDFGYLTINDLNYVLHGGQEPSRDTQWWVSRCAVVQADRNHQMVVVPMLAQQYIDRGQALIPEDKMGEWQEYVNTSVRSAFEGMDIEASLTLLQALEDGVALSDIRQMFIDQGHSGYSASMVATVIEQFGSVEGMGHYLFDGENEPIDTRMSYDGPIIGNDE